MKRFFLVLIIVAFFGNMADGASAATVRVTQKNIKKFRRVNAVLYCYGATQKSSLVLGAMSSRQTRIRVGMKWISLSAKDRKSFKYRKKSSIATVRKWFSGKTSQKTIEAALKVCKKYSPTSASPKPIPTPIATPVFDPCNAGKNYHVSPSGNDTNLGTKDSPFATVERARNVIRSLPHTSRNEPITVCIAEGEYRLSNTLSFTAEDSGSVTAPVIYRKYANQGYPVFKASALVPIRVGDSGKKTYNLSGSNFAEFLNTQANIALRFYFNGGQLQMSRFPRKTVPNFSASDPYAGSFLFVSSMQPNCLAEGGANTASVYTNPLHFPSTGLTLSDAQMYVYPGLNYYSSTNSVVAYNKSTGMFSLGETVGWTKVCANNRFFVQNIPELVTQPGDWSFSKATKTLTVFLPKTVGSNDQLSFPAFYGPAIKVSGAHDLHLVGINVQEVGGTGVFIAESSRVTLDDLVVHGAYGKGGTQIGFGNLDGKGGDGISVWSSENVTVQNSTVYDTAAHGIGVVTTISKKKQLHKTNNIVFNNEVYDIGKAHAVSAGIWLEEDAKAYNNYVHDVPKAGISGDIRQSEIAYNVIERAARETGDIGPIYLVGRDFLAQGLTGFGNKIHHNLIKDTGGYYFSGGQWKFRDSSWGIYLDDGASKNFVYDNIIVGAATACVLNNGGWYNVFDNNICYQSYSGTGAQLNGNLEESHAARYASLQTMGANGYNVSAYLSAFPELASFPKTWSPSFMQRGLVFTHNVNVSTRKNGHWTVLLNGINYTAGVVTVDKNIHYDPSGTTLSFNNGFFDVPLGNQSMSIPFAGTYSWRSHNFDLHGANVNPKLINPDANNFGFAADSAALALGIHSIDQSRMGLQH